MGHGAVRRILLAFALLSSGCIFLTPPIDYGQNCMIDGSSACATCLRGSCQSEIDSACSEAVALSFVASTPTLDALDACGRGEAESCASRIDGSGISDGVKQCLLGSCRQSCVGDSKAVFAWSCASPRSEDGACAACVYDACGAALDDCCGDGSCTSDSELTADVGACVAGDAAGCLYLRKGSESGYAGKVRGCITDSCGDECFPSDGRLHTKCTLVESGRACTCSNARAADGPECSKASIGGTCVLGREGCTCGKYTCTQGSLSSVDCSCEFRGDGAVTECAPAGDDRKCCVKLDSTGVSCECGIASKCYADLYEYDTPSCNYDDVAGAAGELIVSSCSN